MPPRKTTEIVATDAQAPAAQDVTVETLISQAIANNVPVDSLERLLAMRRELKAEVAKEQFDKAMSAFQGECPVIQKTKDVTTRDGKKAYSYAPLDVIVSQTKALLAAHGFSYAIRTETLDSKVRVECVTKHAQGHTESTSVEVPLGGQTQVMSDTQRVAAALTFAKRYAFCNAFGILTGDEDDDAQSTKAPTVPAAQKATPSQELPPPNIVTTKIRIYRKEMVKGERSTRAMLYITEDGKKIVTAFKDTYYKVHEGGTYKVSLDLDWKPNPRLFEVFETVEEPPAKDADTSGEAVAYQQDHENAPIGMDEDIQEIIKDIDL